MEDTAKNFTHNLLRVLAQAAQLATAEGKNKIEPIHLFYGLTDQAEVFLANHSFKKPPRSRIKPAPNQHVALSVSAKRIILDAADIAHSYNQSYIGTEHLLASLLEHQNHELQRMISKMDINPKEMRQSLATRLKTSAHIVDILESLFPPHEIPADTPLNPQEHGNVKTAVRQKKISALEYFGRNLTDQAHAQNIDPVIGRENEMNRLIRILCRRTKNNPVLVGAPGVGKTAIVEGLAKKISAGDVPSVLRGKKIYSLSLTSLTAGSAFRGELEMRFKQILEEVKQDPSVIVFIDEIHNLVGAGASNGSLDAGNILKPALARGELRCIGATTYAEYKKNIEDDPALERRFHMIGVRPSSCEESKAIILGIRPYYETYHRVKITPEAISAAVHLSDRYMTEKCLPDKAIDLIDEAAAKMKVESGYQETVQKERAHAWEQQLAEYAQSRRISSLGNAHSSPLFHSSAYKEHKAPYIGTLTESHIIHIISEITGIPTTRLAQGEQEKLRVLETTLSQKIIGQDHVKKIVANFIRRARSGLTKKGRPLASFAFLGQSGVGKTELAKVLAQEIFGHDGMIKLDMSEFSESFTISRLIGAPSGYIGYKEGGKLTESVRQRPYSLILFDEIEKAHPKILQLLLQILEDGTLTDAAGKKVDFSNTIIILTSNSGSQKILQGSTLGFSETEYASSHMQEIVLKELKEFLSPELLNRIDASIVFRPISRADIRSIMELQISELKEKIQEQHIALNITEKAMQYLSVLSEHPTAGARNVRHTLEQYVENILADTILSSEKKPYTITVDIKKDKNKTESHIICTPLFR
jgi:ATP-dependent Clp protease ATP-binding subunit ClpC